MNMLVSYHHARVTEEAKPVPFSLTVTYKRVHPTVIFSRLSFLPDNIQAVREEHYSAATTLLLLQISFAVLPKKSETHAGSMPFFHHRYRANVCNLQTGSVNYRMLHQISTALADL